MRCRFCGKALKRTLRRIDGREERFRLENFHKKCWPKFVEDVTTDLRLSSLYGPGYKQDHEPGRRRRK